MSTKKNVFEELETVEDNTSGISEKIKEKAEPLFNDFIAYCNKTFDVPVKRHRVKENSNLREIMDNQGMRNYFRFRGVRFSSRVTGTILITFRDEAYTLIGGVTEETNTEIED